MKKIIMLLLVITIFTSYSYVYGDNRNDSGKQKKWYEAALNYIAWKKYWFGTYFGEDCLIKKGKATIEIYSYIFPPTGDYIYGCSSPEETTSLGSPQSTVLIEFGETPISLDVGHARYFKGKKDKLLCVVDTEKLVVYYDVGLDYEPGNRCRKNMQDAVYWDKRYRSTPGVQTCQNRFSVDDIVRDIDIKSAELREASNDALNQAIVKTFTDPRTDFIYEKGESGNKKIFIGPYNKYDPYVLVFYTGNNTIYQIEVPSDICLKEKNSYLKLIVVDHFMGIDLSTGLTSDTEQKIIKKIKQFGKMFVLGGNK